MDIVSQETTRKDEVEDLKEERKKKQVVWCGAQFVLGGGPTTNSSARMNINIAFFEPATKILFDFLFFFTSFSFSFPGEYLIQPFSS
ncbi:hypothetical protein ACN38_g4712 [Penicillium nordicum]|uniref:Uncharacterized protein n=1 Tax=Penicillium nordicum TaxID=229535 RepID=A0A0M8P3H4_9EURO|nr:hypothetical protein ACN38_g4712 [Penicillium nordicum]